MGDKPRPRPLLGPGDLTIDVRPRFRANPWTDPSIRPLTGLDPRVGQWIRAHELNYRFKIDELIQIIRPHPGRVVLVCTGGQHRSVYLAELLGPYFGVPVQHLHVKGGQ